MTKKLSPVAQKARDFYLQQASQDDRSWTQKLRQAFAENAFPTQKDENWQYTRLTGFLQHSFAQVAAGSLSLDALSDYLPEFEVIRLVFVDGQFSAQLSSDLAINVKGVSLTVVSGAEAVADNSTHNERLLQEPMAVLASLQAQAGYALTLDANAALETPVYVLNVQTQSNMAATVNRIALAENAEVTVIEHFVSLTGDAVCAMANNEISVAKHARFKQVVMQQLNTQSFYFNNQFIEQVEESVANTFFASLGGALSRHQNHLYMDGDNIESIQNSACIATGKQTVDSRTYTEHNQLNGMSRQLHKYVLDQQAVGVFDGMIRVDQQAQKTDGQMDNKNLILSDTAKMNSKPQLEIYADDVLCSHGSATGQIDDNQIFYLQARGISRNKAIQMITQAFVLEPLEDINSGVVRHWVEDKVMKTLNQVQS